MISAKQADDLLRFFDGDGLALVSINDLSSLFNIECKSTTKRDNTYSSKDSTSHINLSDSNGDSIDSKLPSTSESVELSDLDHKSSLDSSKSENSSLSKSRSESGELNCAILKEQIFNDYDDDKSGYIDKDEFDKLILSIGEYNSNQVERLWDELNVNHDDKICFEEFAKIFDMDCKIKNLNI